MGVYFGDLVVGLSKLIVIEAVVVMVFAPIKTIRWLREIMKIRIFMLIGLFFFDGDNTITSSELSVVS